MFNITIALKTLIALAVVLAVLFLFLLAYTFWTRQKKQYWHRYEQKFRDYFFSLLLDYVEDPHSSLSVNEIVRKISKRSKDYSFFISLVNELNDILDGTEREQLVQFLKHPVFAEYYQKKLFELSANSQISACLYFQNSGNIDERTLAKLVTLSKSRKLKLAYAATKAMLSADNWSIKTNALQRFFRRPDISELMVAELLHIFDTGLAEERPHIAKSLKKLLLAELPSTAKNIIVRYMGFQQFYVCGDFLFEYLKRLHNGTGKDSLIQGLIVALRELYHTEASNLVQHYALDKYDMDTRLVAISALSTFGGQSNLEFLKEQLLEAEFPVRKAIILALINGEEQGLLILTGFVQELLSNLDHLHNKTNISEEVRSYLDKVSNIASGIQVVINNNQEKVYAPGMDTI